MGSKLKNDFYSWIVDWETKVNDDEWYFYRFRDRLVNNLNSEQAYNLIPDATELFLEQDDTFLLDQCFEILLSLCRKSDTTSMPPILKSNWDKIESRMSHHGKYYIDRFYELKRWYRK